MVTGNSNVEQAPVNNRVIDRQPKMAPPSIAQRIAGIAESPHCQKNVAIAGFYLRLATLLHHPAPAVVLCRPGQEKVRRLGKGGYLSETSDHEAGTNCDCGEWMFFVAIASHASTVERRGLYMPTT